MTAKDVVFTFEGQLNNDKLPYHGQFEQFVKNDQVARRYDDQP